MVLPRGADRGLVECRRRRRSRAARRSSAPASCCVRLTDERGHPQLPRQRRRQRHLQGHHRPRGLRRLRRQRRAQDRRRSGRRCVTNVILKAGVHPHIRYTKLARCWRCRRSSTFSSAASTTAATTARALLGLRGLVFKSHGSADAYAFEKALNRAFDAARNRLLDRSRARPHPRDSPGHAQVAEPPLNAGRLAARHALQ